MSTKKLIKALGLIIVVALLAAAPTLASFRYAPRIYDQGRAIMGSFAASPTCGSLPKNKPIHSHRSNLKIPLNNNRNSCIREKWCYNLNTLKSSALQPHKLSKNHGG